MLKLPRTPTPSSGGARLQYIAPHCCPAVSHGVLGHRRRTEVPASRPRCLPALAECSTKLCYIVAISERIPRPYGAAMLAAMPSGAGQDVPPLTAGASRRPVLRNPDYSDEREHPGYSTPFRCHETAARRVELQFRFRDTRSVSKCTQRGGIESAAAGAPQWGIIRARQLCSPACSACGLASTGPERAAVRCMDRSAR